MEIQSYSPQRIAPAIPQFPRMDGRSPVGEALVGPERRGSVLSMVLLTFHPWPVATAASWVLPSEELVSEIPGLGQYWLQSFPPLNPLNRWLIQRRERLTTGDLGLPRVTVPVFGQSHRLRSQLRLPERESVFMLAMSAANGVLACIGGGWNRAKESRLRQLCTAPARAGWESQLSS